MTWNHEDRRAFLRSPYEDRTRFSAEWPVWRLRKRRGRKGHPREVVEEALRLRASGLSPGEAARRLGVYRRSLVRHADAGEFVERQTVAQPGSHGPRIRTTGEILGSA